MCLKIRCNLAGLSCSESSTCVYYVTLLRVLYCSSGYRTGKGVNVYPRELHYPRLAIRPAFGRLTRSGKWPLILCCGWDRSASVGRGPWSAACTATWSSKGLVSPSRITAKG